MVPFFFRKRRRYFDRLPTPSTLSFKISFSKFSAIGNLKSRLNILVEIITLPTTVFSIPNLTVSISGSSVPIYKNEVAIGLKDYTIDRNKNITRFVMITEDKIKELKFEKR